MNRPLRMLATDGFEVRMVSLSEGRLESGPTGQPSEGLLVPGFVDIHLHGACGIDFMSATSSQMIELADRLEAVGYEFFLPTTVSASASAVLAALENLPDDPRMPGFHLEGPFVSPKYPGAQPPAAIVDPPEPGSEWEAVFDHPKLKIVTLAPERPGALELIERLVDRGVIVSMGHTDATFAEARRGANKGMRHATHTFNAMRGLHHREAGALGFALSDGLLHAELIYDRRHVSQEAASILLRCKREGAVVAVSDSSMATGLPPGKKFKMWGQSVETKAGCVVLSKTETLAGSAMTLADAWRNLAEDFGLETATRACCLNPRLALGLSMEPRIWVEMNDLLELVAVHRL